MKNTSFTTQMMQPQLVKKYITQPMKQTEVNICKTCGKENRRKLQFCSTDCEYWPHLRNRRKI